MLAGTFFHIIPNMVRIPELKPSPYKFHPMDIKPIVPENLNIEDEFNKKRTVFPKETRPGVTPLPDILFKAQDDAEILHRAFEGIGTDEETVLRILTKRSLHQRLKIAEAYKTIFGYVLSHHIMIETSGTFRDLLLALITPPPLIYARDLRDAIMGFGTTDDDLIGILCSLTNREIEAVKKNYKFTFNSNLEDDIRDDTSDQFQELLLLLLKGNRSEELMIDPCKARDEADRLRLIYYSNHNMKLDKEFFELITSVSLPQLAAISHHFRRNAEDGIEEYLSTQFSGDVKHALLAIVKIARDGYPKFFADRLYQAMKGFGTNDKELIRILVTRSEIDLHDIGIEFLKKYKQNLAEWIEGDCSGDYRLSLLCFIGARNC